ncbi:MAG: hypothetical protein HFF84_06480 [Oscillibacter sp.]|nr:hypothetical protein [Oscillibacter sp.]
MAKQYYIKKAPSALGPDIEWISVNGKEFYQLITSSAGKGRYFIDMDDFMIEASEADYKDWRKEKDHSDYLREQEMNLQMRSLSSDVSPESGSSEEIVPDETADTLGMLDTESYRLIDSLILSENRKSERDVASEFGLSQNAVNKRKNKILKKLRFLVVKAEKSSQ